MQSKLGKRTDLKQCCTDAMRIPQLTTAHSHPKTQQEEEEEGEKNEEGAKEAQQTFLFKRQDDKKF